jgi:hypothetical protein
MMGRPPVCLVATYDLRHKRTSILDTKSRSRYLEGCVCLIRFCRSKLWTVRLAKLRNALLVMDCNCIVHSYCGRWLYFQIHHVQSDIRQKTQAQQYFLYINMSSTVSTSLPHACLCLVFQSMVWQSLEQ